MEYVRNAMRKEPQIEVFNAFGDDYDRWFEEKGRLVFETELLLFKSITQNIKSPSIEIGSGSGRFASALRVDFAVEPSKKLREISIKRGVIPIATRGEDVPFDDGIFQTVFIIVTLCFSSRPELILRESARILHKDGNLILGLVLRDSLWGKLYERKKKEGHTFYRVANFYTLEEIENMLESVGLEIYDIYSTLTLPPDRIKEIQKPVHGYIKDAGFSGIIARKIRE